MASPLYEIPVDDIDGKRTTLKPWEGKVLLIVNVASKCGLTPQYEALESVYENYRDQGLVVLGVPCNQFAGQEPGTEGEIKDFCATTFGVDFPLTAKVDVKDDTRHPFYAWAEDKLGTPAVPVWNFHKILIGKDGEAIAAFGPRTEPKDPEIEQAVAAAI